MKYANANKLLPEELLTIIQKYYQGGYLYIPKGNDCEIKPKTAYKTELEKRNQHIYLKHLEGLANSQLGTVYHLSESSVRRIVSRERIRYQKMKELIEQILPLWGIEGGEISQIYPSAWEVNHSYVIKVYSEQAPLDRNIRISTILSDCHIPVAEIALTKTGEKYVRCQDTYFLMSGKLEGSNLVDLKDTEMARKMGCAIAQLHKAFIRCEREIEFWDNSLLQEMEGWIRDNLIKNEWQPVSESEYFQTLAQLKKVYDRLPRQLIHRDVHFGNFLFLDGDFSGYIDFDLSQKNIRIFDVCYFLAGLLAEAAPEPLTRNEWLEHVKSVIAGYESVTPLSGAEKEALPYVMECIEILFAAYYTGTEDTIHAIEACNIFHFIQNCESAFKNI